MKSNLVSKEFSLVFTSNSKFGALNLSNSTTDAGSRFDVALSGSGISIPNEAKYCEMFVSSATIWWSMLNIYEGVNNVFKFGNLIDNREFTYRIPAGIYDLGNLYDAIKYQILNDKFYKEHYGISQIPFTFLSNQATQKVIIQFQMEGFYIDFTVPNSMRQILGFTPLVNQSQILLLKSSGGGLDTTQNYVPSSNTGNPASSADNLTITANNTAYFNIIDSFFINIPTLVKGGIGLNDLYRGTICNVQIDVPVGSQIAFQPYNPVKVNAEHLIGKTISYINNISLTDQNYNPVNTNGENWSFTLTFRYYILV
jgi:hypothetical protein